VGIVSVEGRGRAENEKGVDDTGASGEEKSPVYRVLVNTRYERDIGVRWVRRKSCETVKEMWWKHLRWLSE
jgi:hypothetical protein